MSFTLISVAILLFMALSMGLFAYNGYKKGAVKSLISLALLVACAFCSTFLSNWFSFVFEDMSRGIVESLVIMPKLSSAFGSIYDVITPIAAVIAALFSYIPVFVLLYLWCLWIARTAYTNKVAPQPIPQDRYQREDASYCARHTGEIGAGIGVLFGLIFSIVIVSPIAGLFTTADSAICAVEKFLDDDSIVSSDDDIYYATDDFMITAVSALGGQAIVDMTTVVPGGKGLTSIREEFELLGTMTVDDVTNIFYSIKDGDNKCLEEAMDKMEASVLYRAMVLSVMKNAVDFWNRDEAYLDVSYPFDNVLPPLRSFFSNALNELAMVSEKDFADNISILFNVASVTMEYWSNSSSFDFSRSIEATFDEDVLNDIRKELQSSYRFSYLSSYFDDLGIYVIAKEVFNNSTHTHAARKAFFEELARIWDESNYYIGGYTIVGNMAPKIYTAFASYGMQLPDGADEYFARLLVDNFRYSYGLSSDNISDWLINYVGY